jgi:leader peptidase (prepilin peptidase) / N-methyltransferase
MTPSILLWLFGLWVFAAGGAVGSFLNVVVYRVPLGLSLVRPGSYCPKCRHPIRPYDNIPIFGWLLLGGRCRDCRAPIAWRYPVVEFVVAAMFLAVGWFEWLAPGGTTPLRPTPAAGVPAAPVGLPFAEAGLVAGFHLVLLCTLLAAALAEFDGHCAPWRMALPAIAVGGLAPLVWPHLRPVPACGGFDGPAAGLIDGLAGAALGTCLGAIAWLWFGPRGRRLMLLGPVLAGLFLGWQMAAVAAPGVAIVHAALRYSAGSADRGVVRASPGLIWWAAVFVWILGWNAIVHAWPFLGEPLF